jgi:hypothetical protein
VACQVYRDHAREPTAADTENFAEHAALPLDLAMYKQQGNLLSADFAKNLLQDKMTELAAEIVQSELAAKFANLENSVNSGLSRFERRLDEKKTIGGWMRDIGTSLLSGLALIVILGAAVGGYAVLSKINAVVKTSAGVSAHAPRDSAASGAGTLGQDAPHAPIPAYEDK